MFFFTKNASKHYHGDFRDVFEARGSEYRAWACVQSLKTSLDEHNLEVRVKSAIEAEANSQQKLGAAEAEIAELRQKLDASKRSVCPLVILNDESSYCCQ